MKKLLLFLLSVPLLCSTAEAQTQCGTDTRHTVNISYQEIENYLKHPQARLEADTVFIPLQIHIFKNTAGLQADETAIFKSIEVMNLKFRTIGIQFVVCNAIDYVVSDKYASLDDAYESDYVINNYNSPKAIDVFYVNDVTYWNVCGFASLGWANDGYIFVKQGCENGGTLDHEMGHYFNLLHTHETAYGAELVNGSNCTTAGDQLCDTPADPNLQWEVFWDCKYNGTLKDANGALYKPITDNVMSYSACKYSFTPQQYARMKVYYNNFLTDRYSCSNKTDFVATLDINPATFKKGQDNQVRLFIQNASPLTYNGPLTYRIYLEDPAGTKTVLKTGSISKNFPALKKDTVALVLSVPGSLPDNSYKLITWIDSEEKIDESIETNNLHTQQVGLYLTGGSLPDLIVTFTGETTHYTGETFHAEYQFTNVGNAPLSGSFVNHLFVSEDDQISLDDVAIEYLGWQIGVNEVYKTFIDVGVPAAKSGYIITCADLRNEIEELSDNNNCTTTQIVNLTPPANSLKPDFTITGHKFLFADQYKPKPIEMFYLRYTVENKGPKMDDITEMDLGFYLSKDNVLSTDDILMGHDAGLNSQFEIPLKTVPGKYYVITKADYRNYIEETNESNNTYSFAIEVQPGNLADLQLLSASLSSYRWSDNQLITLNGQVKNGGTTDSDTWNMYVYVQKDSLRFKIPFLHWFNPDFSSEHGLTPLVPVNQQTPVSYSFNIGKKYAPGTYYVATCVNHNNSFSEDRTNNCIVFKKPVVVGGIITHVEEALTEAATVPMQLSPNPAEQEVTVNGEVLQTVELISGDGKVNKPLMAENKFSVSGMPAGLYMVRLSTAKETVYRKLMVR